MIEFSCHCGYRFSMPADQAGSTIQCPHCKRLNDIPLLSDLSHLEDSGIFKLDDAPSIRNNPERVDKLTQVYTREHYDSNGFPIDLRGSAAGAEGPVPVESLQTGNKAAPKYDPVTGELVREFDVKQDTAPHPDAIPTARRVMAPPKTVVNGIDVPEPLEVFRIPVRLFRPINLFVMFLILLANMLCQAMAVAIAGLYLLLVPFWFLIQCMFLSHYANVIDETGPSSRNELPAPLRHIDWTDDTVGPFMRTFNALFICYFPSVLLLTNHARLPTPALLILLGILLSIGSIFFPAVVLTTTTSGSLANLRPDRIIGTAAKCGIEYVLAVITWIVGVTMWLAGIAALNFIALRFVDPSSPKAPFITWPLAYGVLALATYLLHFNAWHLGTLYRKHHESFPWLYQRHDRANSPRPSGFPVQPPRRRRGQNFSPAKTNR